MNSPLVIISSRSFGSGGSDTLAQLVAAGCTVEWIATDHDLDKCREALGEAVAWIAGVAPVTLAHFDAAPRLKVLARYGVGYDAIDLEAASSRGVVVTNTPGANAGAVAEHALGLTLAALRGIVFGDRAVRRGHWESHRGREISALTVGVVGAGRIGMAYAERMRALGAAVLACDPFVSTASWMEFVSFRKLLARCDVVSLHAPGGHELITTESLADARPGAVLVNTARADLVDEVAVAQALHTGHLDAFATDTFRSDRADLPSPILDPALAGRVVLTPHTAAQTVQAIDAMSIMSTDNVLAVLAGRPPVNPVEAP